MADQKIEGAEDAVPIPMYSIQSEIPADVVIPVNAGTFLPYTVTNDPLNPCAEGLDAPIIINPRELNEGNNDGVAAGANARAGKPGDDAPSCCRRYSCCFPLIIATIIWLMMISAQTFEHCQDCLSTKEPYSCEDGHGADYYCKSDVIQKCCVSSFTSSSSCTELPYPDSLEYSMGTYFHLSMYLALIGIICPCLCPFAVPLMVYKDLRKRKYSIRRQTMFDLFCTSCFVLCSVACCWTIFEYYRYPQNRCSTNSERLFGIQADGGGNLMAPNIWIMSQTTYSSFFAMILLAVFGGCGGVTLAIQFCLGCKRRARRRRHRVAKVAAVDDVAPAADVYERVDE